ncbi:WD repeat-containing protein [Verticillium alfalfae VaMs.102]|uniref:WD repeat-containing protein n=1 Tax=Verticillium alfalfae (strain VaMs.102 / ATCC MYA-4576 / FGSC 10136) TaxID=526221 RepID=C9SH28_VERA1|nr:WD repeat-containing protein [Verticillium alfalfae VaMs.102]EEY17622.1 WD repeat-containing protein [Verticillium alfalfae VaMs.102]
MYMLAPVAGHRFTGRDEVYVLDIHRLGAGLASITSDQQLSLFDPARLGAGPITSLPTAHGNIKALRPFDRSASTVCTAGDDGTVALWDLRNPRSSALAARFAAADAPLTALACDAASHTLAVGTEFANHQSSIALDDVTELCFHPAEAPGVLLSGSTDGVVNVYDTRAADEDDVVVQTLNTGSVHHAAFMSASEVYTLTHDEKLAVFNLDAGYEKGTPVADFGDVRAELACQYVANVTAKVDGSGAIIGVGSQDRQNFQLVHLARGSENNSWVFDKASSVGLPGGHGEEIVRAFCFYDDEQVVFTAGEDGYIKAWRPN